MSNTYDRTCIQLHRVAQRSLAQVKQSLASDYINILFPIDSLDLSVQGCIHRMKDCAGWTQMVMGYQIQHR